MLPASRLSSRPRAAREARQLADDAPAPIAETRDLGLMLWDILYKPDGNQAVFFPAALKEGVLEVPQDPEALLAAAKTKGGEAT